MIYLRIDEKALFVFSYTNSFLVINKNSFTEINEKLSNIIIIHGDDFFDEFHLKSRRLYYTNLRIELWLWGKWH